MSYNNLRNCLGLDSVSDALAPEFGHRSIKLRDLPKSKQAKNRRKSKTKRALEHSFISPNAKELKRHTQ